MERSLLSPFYKWPRFISISLAIMTLVTVGALCLVIMSQAAKDPNAHPHYHDFICICLYLFIFSTFLAWLSFKLTSGIIFAVLASIFSLLASYVTQSFCGLIQIVYQGTFCFLLYYLDQKNSGEVIAQEVEIEKAINERNDLELTYKEKGTNISVSFEKFTSYYNLRKLANDFSTTLSLSELSAMIVSKAIDLIGKGQYCFLFLADPDSGNLSLVASKSAESGKKTKAKAGDIFDFWILRNRQSLIIADTQKDFRFDLKKTQEIHDTRSVIASPLSHEGKMVGTLRLSSDQPAIFTTDDLRLLDAISTLASSAVSNSILFQKTEELAIRDSLTGLYVRRYFLERLSEEHRRSLLTKSPLTLLMCDLDHFKKCNDRYGHGVGDFVLTKTADVLTREAKHGIVARYGGEEFAVLLPRLTLSDGKSLAESIRQTISKMTVSIRREHIPITISIGVASISEDTLDPEELIRIADQRLYKAKKAGRNRTC